MPKTPITYYGGKLNLLKEILPLIPPHKIYTESFFGGGAVFFAKEPVESETINDTYNLAIVFYEQVKTNFKAVKQKIESTLFARRAYMKAKFICENANLYSKLMQAWAFHIATNCGFSCQIGSWGYDKYGKRVKAFLNKKILFNKEIAKRLEHAQIENNDALKVIKSRDAVDAFHYVDPPYIDTNQGHYGGYTKTHFKNLLETLSEVQGKFLLSSYPSKLLTKYTKKHGWYTKVFDKPLSARKAVNGKSRGRKIEVLTANYPI